MNEGSHRLSQDLDIKFVDVPVKPRALARTEAAITGAFAGKPGRICQARSFIKRAKKSDIKRRAEKAARKKNRRR